MRILLVEDDASLASGIRLALKPEGYTVDHLSDGVSARSTLLEGVPFDAVILDLGLPRLDGIAVLKAVRLQGSQIPILVLTARDAINERIAGLDAGADDYLIKPFDVTELTARLRALLRRSQGQTSTLLECQGVLLNPITLKVSYQGQEVALSRRELTLLQEFMSHPGRVFTRDTLAQLVYGWDEDVESNAIEVHIHHLRRKFSPHVIRTVRGIGYVMDKSG
ncbi:MULTISPECIES: response regulator transcription factor [unclassified Halomonas]|uniref:response regulator transcription factor n=1 Tax=unclassified Halomonas TaxID=2609666 RepID=UPI0006DB7081|nr:MULTISPECIES: response regulator transcription factor [unclassified Halomonas]KPQ27199.1 MAG: two-component system, OmpR family, response regulator [Halomonas sp. HL-93]SBR52610.1 two-component system, OmpR family, response regulator [Halomonas sp. HL-93]SNY97932.1 two-component system, OmpR family, response regulator [Halomonas sp. hl-4]